MAVESNTSGHDDGLVGGTLNEKIMATLTEKQLDTLMGHHEGPVFSVYMATHRTHPDNAQGIKTNAAVLSKEALRDAAWQVFKPHYHNTTAGLVDDVLNDIAELVLRLKQGAHRLTGFNGY